MPFIVLYWFIEILREIFLRLARPIHPWTTYDNLATRTLFPTLTYHDLSTHTAPYSGRTTITNPPRFSYYDPHIRAHVLSRYRTAIQRRHLEKQACPPDVEYLWKGVLGHIKDTPYTDEGWVGSLMDSVVSVLRPLVRDMSDPGASLKMEYPKLFASQRGDRNLVLMKGADGIGEGLKTTAVLNRYWPDFSGALILEEGKLTDAKAVLMKLGIQLLLLQEAGVQNVRFGLIITGLECYVVELAATTLHGQHLRGVAISDPIELSNSSMFSDGGVQSVVTLILGLLMPPSIVPYHEDRDPAHHAPPSDWTGLRKLITDQVLRRVGGGGGVGGRGGIGDEGLRGRSHGNEGPGAGDRRTLSEGGKDQREQCPSALSKGTFLVYFAKLV
ncbi:hypothetical protein DFH09DRAFT_322687 [Mycena vulgaris]|nr:hypothetical protein DFH09DRAFT_322687 [Mycena vulgaris]